MASQLDGLTPAGTYGTQPDDNDHKPSITLSREDISFRQLLHEEAVVPLEQVVLAAVKPLIGHVQDTNCHLQELFALGPMSENAHDGAPICNTHLARLLAEAFAKPSASSNVKRAIRNPDVSTTESDASEEEDCHKFDSLLRLLDVSEAGRTKQWAFDRLAVFSSLDTLIANERVSDIWAENTLAQLQVEQEKLRIKLMAGRSAARVRKDRIARMEAARAALKRHMQTVGLKARFNP